MRSQTAWILVAALLSLLHETGPSRASATERLSQATLSRIWAITPDADHGRILYLKHCTACHGRHAWGDGYQEIPALAGQREKYLVLQLTQLAIGKRDGQLMHQTLQKPDLDWAQAVRDLSAYLSGARRSPGPEYGESRDISAGRRVYEEVCSGCHGARGEGKDTGVPAIGGQHYRYLLAQLRNFSYGHRGAGNLQLLESMGGLTPPADENVANYVSRLSYLTAEDSPP